MSLPLPQRNRLTIVVAATVVSLDASTKLIARGVLPLSPQVDGSGPRLGGVGFERVWNAGSAGGIAQGRLAWPLIAIGGLALAALIAFASPHATGSGRRARIAAGLLIGGASSNVAERLLTGGVTDFVAIGGAARGCSLNVADLALVVGTFLLVLCRPRLSPASPTACERR